MKPRVRAFARARVFILFFDKEAENMKLWNMLKEMWNKPPAEPLQTVDPPKTVESAKPDEPPVPSGSSLSQWYTFGRNTPYKKAEVIFTHPEKNIERAIISTHGYIRDFPGIDQTVPEEYASIARNAKISFRTDFERCPDGTIRMIWEIQPDGRYWEDEDGYGGTPDEEVTLWSILDETGSFTGPFRLYRVGVCQLDSWEMCQAEKARTEGRTEDEKRWYLEAAKQGIVQAQYETALLLHSEPEQAFSWMMQAAKSWMPEAMQSLSRYYADGFGCTADPQKAAYWADIVSKIR